jgi:hypothetical protein
VLAGGADLVVAVGAKGDAPDDLVGGCVMPLGVYELP